MIKKLRNYILFLCLIALLPVIVSAHELSFGTADKQTGKTVIPINLKASQDMGIGSALNFSCEVTGAYCTVAMDGIDGVSSAGALAKDVKAGDTILVAKLELINSSYGEVSVSPVVSGLGTSISITTTIKGKQALKTSSKFSTLTTSQGKIYPAFNENVKEYTIYNVKDTIVTTYINYTCENCVVSAENYGSLAVNPGTNQVKVSSLVKGENTLTLVVRSEDGNNTTSYNFTVYRGETTYDSAKLSALAFGDYKLSPEFKKSVKEYSLEVPYSVKDLTDIISATLEDKDAEMKIEGLSNLAVGSNDVTINITSVNKDNKEEYKITVTRLTSEDVIVKKYIDGKITFLDSEGETQTATEEEFKEDYPTVWKDIESGKLKFDEDGNLVIEEEKKEEPKKKTDKKQIIVIAIIAGAIIIIGLSGYFLFRKKDPEKEKKKEEEKIKKKAEKKARKEELKKLEAEYYNEYYGDDEDEDEDDEEEEKSKSKSKSKKAEISDEDKLSKNETESLLEDDYIFESSLLADNDDEEEEEMPKKKKNEVLDVDSALEDLMNTKTYDFSDELKNIDEDDEEDE